MLLSLALFHSDHARGGAQGFRRPRSDAGNALDRRGAASDRLERRTRPHRDHRRDGAGGPGSRAAARCRRAAARPSHRGGWPREPRRRSGVGLPHRRHRALRDSRTDRQPRALLPVRRPVHAPRRHRPALDPALHRRTRDGARQPARHVRAVPERGHHLRRRRRWSVLELRRADAGEPDGRRAARNGRRPADLQRSTVRSSIPTAIRRSSRSRTSRRRAP